MQRVSIELFRVLWYSLHGKPPTNTSLTVDIASTNLKHIESCSLSVASSAIIARYGDFEHSDAIESLICLTHRYISSFCISGEVYLYSAVVFAKYSESTRSSLAFSHRMAMKLLLSSVWHLIGMLCFPQSTRVSMILLKIWLLILVWAGQRI